MEKKKYGGGGGGAGSSDGRDNKKLPKRRLSRKKSSLDHSEVQLAHKLKEYRNLVKIETSNPSIQGSIVPINQIVNFQDSEIKEIMNFTDEYLRSLLENIESSDNLIGVDLYNSNTAGRPGDNKNEKRLIEIRDLVDVDLLRNGLQSAVAINCQIKTPSAIQSGRRSGSGSFPRVVGGGGGGGVGGDTYVTTSSMSTSQQDPKLSEAHRDADDTGLDDLKDETTSSCSTLCFNYQMVVALNNDYFKVEEPSNSQIGLLKIRLARKPIKWTERDLADLTIQTLKAKRQNHATGMHYDDSHIYLNSKALVDRLYGHFSTTMRENWPKRQPVVVNPLIHRIQIVGEESDLEPYHMHNGMLYRSHSTSQSGRSSAASSRRQAHHHQQQHHNSIQFSHQPNHGRTTPSGSRLENRGFGGSRVGRRDEKKEENMKRKCVLDMNRIRIEFKWKGNKPHLRNLKVCMVIAVVVDINHKFDLESRTSEILAANKIDASDWQTFSEWMSPRLSLMPNSRRVFVSPASFVHLWTLDTRVAKLNLLKQLLVYEQLKLVAKSTRIGDLMHAGERTNILNGSYSLQACIEEMARVANQQQPSTMLTYFRLMQIYFSQFLEKWKPSKSSKQLNIQDMDSEELLVNLLLDEARSDVHWSHEHLFERVWSSLVKLRSQLGVDQDVADVFGLVRNQVPGYILGSCNMSPLVASFETMMRQLIKNVMTIDDLNVQVVELVGMTPSSKSAMSPLDMTRLDSRMSNVRRLDESIASSRDVNLGASTRKTLTSHGSIRNQQV